MRSIVLILSLILLFACDKEKDNYETSPTGVLNEFISLSAEQDSVITGGSTKVTAVVDGELIIYLWSATQGDILGNGSQITWVAPACVCGNGIITCKVRAGGRELSKTIEIIVLNE